MWSASIRASITLHNFVVYGRLKVKLAGILSYKPLRAFLQAIALRVDFSPAVRDRLYLGKWGGAITGNEGLFT
jgi:hypothetical protein